MKDLMKKRFLFITSTTAAAEAVWVFCTRLLQENQDVAVMGPSQLKTPEGVEKFSRITESRDFEPDVVVPLDEVSIRAVQGIFTGEKKPKFLNREPLAYQMASSRSFGLSLLAKAGISVAPYHVINNQGDLLRFQARTSQLAEGENFWELYCDHPDFDIPIKGEIPIEGNPLGVVGIEAPLHDHKVQLAFLMSGRNMVKPCFAYAELKGLLARGGVKDYRGMVVVPISGPEVSRIGDQIKVALSAIGANGFVFVDLLYNDGKPTVSRISLTPPRGFLPALFLSGILQQPLSQALYSTSKGVPFNWQIKWNTQAFAHLITDTEQGPGLPDEQEFHLSSFHDYEYEVGYSISCGPVVHDSLWDIRPTAEANLHSGLVLQETLLVLKELGLFSLERKQKQQDPTPSEEEEVVLEEVVNA